MNKLYWVLMLLLMRIPYALGMEEKELTAKEAGDLFWKSVEQVSNLEIPYAQYRANLIRAIPYLNYTQDYYHNPLALAVKARDYEFTKFLLDHNADPVAKDMSQQSALDVLEEKGGLYQPEVEQQTTTEEEDQLYKGLLRNLLNEYITKKQN